MSTASRVSDQQFVQAAPRGAEWSLFLAELDCWIAAGRDASVPQSATGRLVGGVPFALGRRVKVCRVQYRRGALDPVRIRELEARPGWSWDGYSARSAKVWNRHLSELRDHLAERGTLDGLETVRPLLARWLRQQRTAELTPAQRRALAPIPGVLEVRKGRLDQFISLVRGWVALDPDRDAGDVRFSTVHRVGTDDASLGRRVAYWRSRYAAGQLDATEIAAIEDLPGWRWATPDARPQHVD